VAFAHAFACTFAFACACPPEVRSYPTVETIQKDSICHRVIAPADAPSTSLAAAAAIASRAVASFSGGGIFGVELFLLPDHSVLLNEIAPRPHNSGHYTMDACHTDQFEQHLRCVLGLPLGSTGMKSPSAAMLNILGDGSLPSTLAPVQRALTTPAAAIHWYGKSPPKAARKMGHINVTGPTAAATLDALARLEGHAPGGATAAGAKRARSEGGNGSTAGGGAPLVGVIMGSDSDLPCMQQAAEILEKFGVPYEITIVSAHRTPQRLFDYSREAEARGLRVIIAGAGGAAHLPGMVAALTPLPVIGVPVKSSMLSGNDSLLSIVQMPKGVPVATVAIHNAANAGLLAVRMLGMADASLRTAMATFMQEQEAEVLGKAAKLEQAGYKGYS
jgi:phosphoribosylaminoimidazole carboxylase